jgi:hypothetical protein
MSKTIALVSNNIFYNLGLQKYVSDYELKTISSQNLEEEDLEELLIDINLVLVKNEGAVTEKTLN